MKKYLILGLLVMITVGLQAQQIVKRIYIGNDDHTDYMWTADEKTYDKAFTDMLDYYLNQIDSTRNNPDDFQARWNCDCSYWLMAYQKYRTPIQFERLISRIRDGHISSPLNLLVNTYGAQPAEAAIRGMYYAGQLERRYQIRFPMAISMENQTQPLGLSSLWAGSGAKYSWKGVCACGTRLSKKGLSRRKYELYNYAGPDDRSVLMKWYSHVLVDSNSRTLGAYAENRRLMGSTDILKDLSAKVTELDNYCDTLSPKSRYPYNASAAFGYGSDDLQTYNSPAFVTTAQATTTPYRKVRVSNEIDFFKDIEKHYPKIPSQSVTFGNEWDLYCATMNETTAQVRRSTEKLRTAESIATMVSLKNADFGKNLDSLKNKAWTALGMYWEHDWTADGPVSRKARAEWQIRQKDNLVSYVDTLYNSASRALGGMIKATNTQRVYIYNPLNWVRSDVADINTDISGPIKVLDPTSGKEAQSQVIQKNGKRMVRIWAENIPSSGYRVYELRSGEPLKGNNLVSYQNGILQNNFFKLRVHPSGVITELYDQQDKGRSLIKADHGRFLNDLGTTAVDEGHLSIENSGPVSVTVRAVSANPIPHTVRITMYASCPRIDIQDSINANFKDVKTWSFSFNLNKPTTNFEEVGAILKARLKTNGGDYATENARYDWQTFNHFADVSEKNYGITLSNVDCNFFKLGQSTIDSLYEDSPQINALAGGQTDDAHLGIHDQNGQSKFEYHFALGIHHTGFDPVVSMKFALEHQNPLAVSAVTGQTELYPQFQYSFLKVDVPGVLLWSLKPAEEGISSGVIARFWNLNPLPVKANVDTRLNLQATWQTTHIETNENKIPFSSGSFGTSFSGSQFNTYRLESQR